MFAESWRHLAEGPEGLESFCVLQQYGSCFCQRSGDRDAELLDSVWGRTTGRRPGVRSDPWSSFVEVRDEQDVFFFCSGSRT